MILIQKCENEKKKWDKHKKIILFIFHIILYDDTKRNPFASWGQLLTAASYKDKKEMSTGVGLWNSEN